MIDPEIIATKLSKLRQALLRLQGLASRPLAEYLASETDRALAEHYLRIALEVMLDAGNHVIAAEGFRKPLQLREIPLILAEHGVLAGDLADRLARAAGLRNRLVHLYQEIDHTVIHGLLNEDLVDLERFAVAIGSLCDRLPP